MGAFSLSIASVYKVRAPSGWSGTRRTVLTTTNLQAATGLDLPFTQIGKPHHLTYEFADSMLTRHTKQLRGVDQDLNV